MDIISLIALIKGVGIGVAIICLAVLAYMHTMFVSKNYFDKTLSITNDSIDKLDNGYKEKLADGLRPIEEHLKSIEAQLREMRAYIADLLRGK